jgi:hypothetical protein
MRKIKSFVDDGLSESTREALLRSLTELLGKPSRDDHGMYFVAASENRLGEIDLKLAYADRDRRVLVADRRRLEGELRVVEATMDVAVGDAIEPFSSERDTILQKLDEVYLSIADLDRRRKKLKAERKKLEA